MQVRIIKGTRQIGGCITEITVNKTKIIIDFGNDLNSKEEFELDGLTKGKSKYHAVFITHYHIDHIGLINNVNKDIPVYVEDKSLKIHNLTCDFCNKKKVHRYINTFEVKQNTKNDKKEERKIFDNGDIQVYAYLSDHSAYNSCMFLVEGNNKKLLHMGDFRMHGRKAYLIRDSLNKIGKVDILVTEGTTLTRLDEKALRENELEKKAMEVMRKYNQVLIMQSSTNFDRTVSFLRASIKSHKKFIIDLFSYHLQDIINRFIYIDYHNIYLWKPYQYQWKNKTFQEKYLNMKNNLKGAFPSFTMEVKDSMLQDINKLYAKGLLNNSCLIYSMWDGYLKKNRRLNFFIQELKKMNIDIIYLHTSGHANYEEFKLINTIVNPDKTIIIHTENGKIGNTLFNNNILIKDNEVLNLP